MGDQIERQTTSDFEAVRQQYHLTNLDRLRGAEELLRERAVPVAYWTYIIRNGNDSVQPPQGAICYDRECAEELMTPGPSVQVLWRSHPTFEIFVVDGRDVTLVKSLAQDNNDRGLEAHTRRMA
jgi:hypothetical protein